MDERNVIIKEKAGNITNMFNTILLGVATVIFICLDYIIPAIIVGSIIAIQPIILIIISSVLEKKNVEIKVHTNNKKREVHAFVQSPLFFCCHIKAHSILVNSW